MTTLFLPCASGVESLLADEVQRITGNVAENARGGVWVEGDECTAMQLNLESRLAQRVLWPLVDGPYRDEHDLYALARRVPWPQWITPEQSLRVDVSAQRSPLTSLNFAALRIKDAVCDSLRESTGARPGVDTRRPDLPLALFVGPEHATLYADTSGEALFKRGWREAGRAEPRTARCSTPAAAPARSPSRRRRSPAASRPARCGRSPSNVGCPSGRSCRRGANCSARPGSECTRPRWRSSPAT